MYIDFSDTSDIANAFDDYYWKLYTPGIGYSPQNYEPTVSRHTRFYTTDLNEEFGFIHHLKTRKAPGHDMI